MTNHSIIYCIVLRSIICTVVPPHCCRLQHSIDFSLPSPCHLHCHHHHHHHRNHHDRHRHRHRNQRRHHRSLLGIIIIIIIIIVIGIGVGIIIGIGSIVGIGGIGAALVSVSSSSSSVAAAASSSYYHHCHRRHFWMPMERRQWGMIRWCNNHVFIVSSSSPFGVLCHCWLAADATIKSSLYRPSPPLMQQSHHHHPQNLQSAKPLRTSRWCNNQIIVIPSLSSPLLFIQFILSITMKLMIISSSTIITIKIIILVIIVSFTIHCHHCPCHHH